MPGISELLFLLVEVEAAGTVVASATAAFAIRYLVLRYPRYCVVFPSLMPCSGKSAPYKFALPSFHLKLLFSSLVSSVSATTYP